MIAARQAMHGLSRGNRLPDGIVAIEYLESTGTQWIDTDIPYDSTKAYDVVCNCCFNEAVKIYYMWTGWDAGGQFGSVEGNNWDLASGGSVNAPLRTRVKISLNIERGTATKTTMTISGYEGTGTRLHPLLSSYCEGIGYPIFAMRSTKAQVAPIPLRVWDLRLFANGELVRDLIPVRKGNVGYMYDKVSGKLFGNSGTGEFILGADKKPADTTVSAKSYVQDGLVSLWDGIENVEWGKHDSNATVWKDLVGGMDATLQDGAIWDGNALARGTCTTAMAKSVAKISGVQTIEAVFRSTNGLVGVVCSTGVAQNLFFIRAENTTLRTAGYGSKFGTYTNAIVVNKTHSVCTSYTDSTTSAVCENTYVDGLSLGEGQTSTQGHVAPVNMFGGANGTDRPFYGEIFAVRYYNRALTAEEVAHNYAVDKERFGLE